MAAKNKPYEQFGPYILFKKLETDALGDLWRAARIDGNAARRHGCTSTSERRQSRAMLASIGIARQVVPLLTGPSFARDQVIDEVNGVPFIAHDYAGGRSLRHVVDRARGGAGVSPNPIPMDSGDRHRGESCVIAGHGRRASFCGRAVVARRSASAVRLDQR